MPELPEVEVIKLGLQKRIMGLKLTKIQVIAAKSFIGNPNKVLGQKVLKVWRRAKILGVDLDKMTLLFHLKMSGQLVWIGNSRFIGGHPTQDMVRAMPNKHTRVIFSFSDGSHLYFNDQRLFGWVRISSKLKIQSEKFFEKLGPEPLEKTFTWQILKSNLLLSKKGRVNRKSQSVKVALMDQSVVSGAGNIYANEACFNARIDPRTKVTDLTDQEFKSIHQGIIKSLQDGIRYGGSTRAHFVDYAYCYGKDKQKCQVCGTQIKKIALGGRGTYFCPNCQK